MRNYDDIINLQRPISKHPKMSLYQRSAQFAPFAALTGYDGQVKETARLTDKRIELDEEVKLILDMKIQVIQEMLSNRPKVEITYFIPDTKKDGGKYETIVNNVKKIDNYNGQIIMQNDLIIDKNLLTRRITISANNVINEEQAEKENTFEQIDLFTDYHELEKKHDEEKKERNLQRSILDIKKKYGKNAILKGMNFEDGGTTIERNEQVGGHKA